MRYAYACLLLFCVLFLTLCSCSNQDQTVTNPSDTSWQLLPFKKLDSINPILSPAAAQQFVCPVRKQNILWEVKDVFNPAAVVRHDTVFLLYRAQDSIGKPGGTSRIGLAWSTNGIHFIKHLTPVLYPDNDDYKILEWEGGCEDPRIAEDANGLYYMTYTAYDGHIARLLVATSPDLYHWTKHGPAFNGRYKDFWSKSGAIVCQNQHGKMVAQKIKGRYWMYWGDQNIWAATSEDLIHWQPVTDSSAQPTEMERRGIAAKAPELKAVLSPRSKKFDSDLVESGPQALIREEGILLLYNSRNIPAIGDSSLPEGTYAAAQALMDKNNPLKVLKRSDSYFIKPDRSYEISGQVNRVCFIEGLVHYKNQWFLYYGTADSKIAVAVKSD